MARKREDLKQNLTNIFARTTLEQSSEQPAGDDPVKPIGVGLRESEKKKIETIAAELGLNRHALLIWIIRDFIRRWDAGDRPETETRKVLKHR